ncbi:MAG: Ca-activated chloride channel family protein, partial [Enterobacterales bacterium]
LNPSKDLDEKTLIDVAEATGGKYFRAKDTSQLEQIYAVLDEIEPVESNPETFRPVKSLFYWPLAVALLLAFLLAAEKLLSFKLTQRRASNDA